MENFVEINFHGKWNFQWELEFIFSYAEFMGIPEFLGSGRKSRTLDSGRWTLEADFKDGPDIMLSELACF